jgi:hypothetical protein
MLVRVTDAVSLLLLDTVSYTLVDDHGETRVLTLVCVSFTFIDKNKLAPTMLCIRTRMPVYDVTRNNEDDG